MDLQEYLWKEKILMSEFAKKINASRTTISLLKRKKFVPGLFMALKIFKATNGQVTLLELLPDEQIKQLDLF